MSEMINEVNELSEHYQVVLNFWIILSLALLVTGIIAAIAWIAVEGSKHVIYLPFMASIFIFIMGWTVIMNMEKRDRYYIAEEYLPVALTEKVITKLPLNYSDSETELCKLGDKDSCTTIFVHDSEGRVYEVYLRNKDYFELKQGKTYYVSFPVLSKVDLNFLNKYNYQKFYFDAVEVKE